MTLEDYAYLVEIVGGVFVVVTLIFVIIQLRQNTLALRSSTLQGIHNQTMTAYQMMMDDVLMDALVKGMSDPGELTPRERGKFNAFWTVALQSYQHSYFQIRSGAFDPREFGGWWQVLRNNFESPGFREHWDRRKYVLAEEFRAFVETDVLARDAAPHG